jgi:hypothetical protein
MSPRPVFAVSALLVAGCAGLQQPDPSNVAAYCTGQNGYRLGSQMRAYYGSCPKESEAAFLAGLQRGRAVRPSTPAAEPYFAQMDELERQLRSATSDAERERLRSRLREAEYWAIHIVNDPGSYTPSGPR